MSGMRYVLWAIKLVVFAVVVLFAYKNMAPVDVQFFGDMQFVSVPLVIVILIAFVLGTVLGVFLMLPSTWRGRREAGRLKRDLKQAQKVSATSAQTSPTAADSAVKPL
jgi:lipopolysaccharide assembly protein A